MTVVTGGIFPHGSGLIPGFIEKGNRKEFVRLRRAAKKASELIHQKNPDTIVLATPHNLRIKGHIGIVVSENCGGSLSFHSKTVKISVTTDVNLANIIQEESLRRDLHAVSVNYGTDTGPLSSMPLDWGTVVPLYFLNKTRKIVLITPSRELPWKELVDFGMVVKSAAKRLRRRVAFIASADQAHTHSKDGPYGYDRAAKLYDELVLKLVEQAKLDRLLSFNPDLLQKAKPDSFWQMLILYGALHGVKYKTLFSYYGRPSYYGMLVAVLA
ncbi:MAG: hypothetical protein QXV32_00435 [Conexivisphaerales archaeon]